jgi:hypothetical protein
VEAVITNVEEARSLRTGIRCLKEEQEETPCMVARRNTMAKSVDVVEVEDEEIPWVAEVAVVNAAPLIVTVRPLRPTLRRNCTRAGVVTMANRRERMRLLPATTQRKRRPGVGKTQMQTLGALLRLVKVKLPKVAPREVVRVVGASVSPKKKTTPSPLTNTSLNKRKRRTFLR